MALKNMFTERTKDRRMEREYVLSFLEHLFFFF